MMGNSRFIQISALVFATGLALFFSAMPAMGADEISDAKKILESLSMQSQEVEICKKWDAYLQQMTGFTNEEYQLAIVGLAVEFAHALSDLENCINKSEREKQYSSDWMKDFQKDFSDEFISNNLTYIKFVLQCMYERNRSGYYETAQKEAVYKEIQYREVLRQYTRNLINFSETLDKQSQGRIIDRTTVAKVILDMPENPLRKMLVHEDKAFLYSTALKNRKDIDPRLIEFFSGHPFFSRPFDLMRAAGEFKKYEKAVE